MRFRVTLRSRIAATVAVAVLGSTVAVTIAAYQLERNGTESRFVAAARTGAVADLQQAANAVDRQPEVPAAQAVADFVQQRGGIGWIVVDNGHSNNEASPGVSLDDVPSALLDDIINGDIINGGLGGTQSAWTTVGGARMLAIGGLVRSATRQQARSPSATASTRSTSAPTVASSNGVALVEFYDFSPVDQQLGRLRGDLIRLDIAGLILALLLGVLVATGISRPVRLAAAAARQLGSGALDTRVPVHGNDELGDLATSFNDMAERLSQAMRALQTAQAQQRRFVADVSHELRTPLAAMLAAADGLDSTDPELRQRAGELVGEQTRRMGSLVENLLEISRFDAGQARLVLEEVDLEALIHDVVRTVGPDQDVQVQTLGEPTVRGDARRLHTILRNLIGNALQHGEPPVRVVIDGHPGWVRVTVSDAGPGIDPAIAPTLFDRFVRGDASRTTGSGSTGLGLAIARENAQLHGATLSAATDGTAAFVLTLRRVPPGAVAGVEVPG